MNPDFWLDRWERGEIGFHRDETNPYLKRFWPSLDNHLRVFVPLCGKSLDMQWLHQQGANVLGVELSPLAVTDFFQVAGLSPLLQKSGALDSYKARGIELLCGDFFAVTPAHVTGYDMLYDRAALIAMPHELRTKYVMHIRDLFPRGTEILLVTLEYIQAEMDGPPFSVSDDEVHSLYQGAHIERLLSLDVLQDNERFRARGMSRLFENVYLIRL